GRTSARSIRRLCHLGLFKPSQTSTIMAVPCQRAANRAFQRAANPRGVWCCACRNATWAGFAKPVRGVAKERDGHSMERHKLDRSNGGNVDDSHQDPADGIDETNEDHDELVATAATVGVVGLGVIVFEAALLPGLVLGVVTMMVPKYLPRLGEAVTPLVKSTVRGAYKMGQKTREMVAEVQEQMHDIVAEVDAEAAKKASAPKAPLHPAAPPAV